LVGERRSPIVAAVTALDFLDDELHELERLGRLREPRVVAGRQGTKVRIDGRDVVSFSSNDYLGLASDGVLREAAVAEIDRSGVGAGASRLIVGNREAHVELEAVLAQHFRCESALLFNSGYAANTGLLPVLAGEQDSIFSDRLNHASLIDGCRLSRARVEVFEHLDYEQLDEQLARSSARRKVVVTESVFSMDGDRAGLAALREITQRRDAILVVDEAHAVGVLGPCGGGLLEEVGVDADVVVGTLGKAVGAAGACVAGSRALTSLLWNRARSLVFSTGIPPMVASAAKAGIALIRGPDGASRRESLARNIALFSSRQRSPICPVHVGDDREVMRWTSVLLESGLFVQGIRPPTVPPGTSRLRIALSSSHEPAEIARLQVALDMLTVPRGTR